MTAKSSDRRSLRHARRSALGEGLLAGNRLQHVSVFNIKVLRQSRVLKRWWICLPSPSSLIWTSNTAHSSSRKTQVENAVISHLPALSQAQGNQQGM